MVLIHAPSGYGKTCLLSSVAQEWTRFAQPGSATRLAWYRLDPRDDDAAAFVAGLLESVGSVLPGFGGLTRAALHSAADARGQIPRLIELFLDELRGVEPERLFIVLDGFHHITDRTIVDALERALLDPERPLRLILSTAEDPRLFLSPLRARDELVELRADDLRFTKEEMWELVRHRANRQAPRTALDSVVRGTGGWPSAANLASLIVARDLAPLSFPRLAPTEHGYALLVREMLAGLPPETRGDVLKSSLLARLDLDGFREGVGIADPESTLSVVEEAGLPVVRPMGRDLPLYYEPLFRSALEQEFGRVSLAHEYRSLQGRVASYYASRGDLPEALGRYLQMEAHEDAARLLESAIDAERLEGRPDLLLRWLRRLPASVRNAHPRLMLQEARLHLSRERPDEARVLLLAARPALDGSEDRVTRGRQACEWATLRLQERRYPEAASLALDALKELPEEWFAERAEAWWLLSRALEPVGDLAAAFSAAGQVLLEAERSGRPPLVERALLQAGAIAQWRGEYDASLALSARAVQRAALWGRETLAINIAGGSASAAYLERGLLGSSLKVARGLLATSQRLRDLGGQVRALLALSMAMELSGERDRGKEMLDRARELSERLAAGRPERALVLRWSAASLLRMGKRKEGLERARAALQAARESDHRPLTDQCQLVLAAGEMVGARVPVVMGRVRRLIGSLQGSDNRRWLAAGLRLVAEGYDRLGLRWQAQAHLRRSLALAAEGVWIGMPLGLPSSEGRLLALAVRKGIAHETAATMLGVDPTEAERRLAPLLGHRDPRVRSRAEQTLKGMRQGLGRAPAPRLTWPAIDSASDGERIEVSLHSLGRFDARVGGVLVEWPSVDARNLSAYLLVRLGVAVPREELLRDVWPQDEPWKANLRLHEALFRIREALGAGYPPVDPRLDGEGVYRWDGNGCAIDAERFRGLVAEARVLVGEASPTDLPGRAVGLLEEAVSLYRGEFLDGLEFAWCEAPREDLRRQLLWATRVLMDHYIALQRWRDAIRHGRKSLESDPLQEDVVRDLMVCHFRLGDRPAVDRLYRESKRLLAMESARWPSEETRELRLRLLGTGAGWARTESRQPSVVVVGKR